MSLRAPDQLDLTQGGHRDDRVTSVETEHCPQLRDSEYSGPQSAALAPQRRKADSEWGGHQTLHTTHPCHKEVNSGGSDGQDTGTWGSLGPPQSTECLSARKVIVS